MSEDINNNPNNIQSHLDILEISPERVAEVDTYFTYLLENYGEQTKVEWGSRHTIQRPATVAMIQDGRRRLRVRKFDDEGRDFDDDGVIKNDKGYIKATIQVETDRKNWSGQNIWEREHQFTVTPDGQLQYKDGSIGFSFPGTPPPDKQTPLQKRFHHLVLSSPISQEGLLFTLDSFMDEAQAMLEKQKLGKKRNLKKLGRRLIDRGKD